MSEAPAQLSSIKLTAELPAASTSATLARRLVRALEASTLDADKTDRAELVISELVSNAIRHASRMPGDRVSIELWVSDHGIEGAVTDCGEAFSLQPDAVRTEEPGGFGLHIIDQLVTRWNIGRHAEGNRVSFTI